MLKKAALLDQKYCNFKAAITLVFRATWSFRNYFKMLIRWVKDEWMNEFTEKNYKLNTQDFFLCTQKAYFSQILFTNMC